MGTLNITCDIIYMYVYINMRKNKLGKEIQRFSSGSERATQDTLTSYK